MQLSSLKPLTLSLVIPGLALSGLALPGHAQEQGEAALLEEVIVTAQRREQSLQEVPVSLSVFSSQRIEQSNIKSAIDYLAFTPNVSFTEDGQTGSRGLGIAVRGVNNLVSGENAFVNSVGIYLDEFSVASVPNQVANPMLPDMQRVEVLRGPQGTFFGRNSLGGALNLVTNKPTDELTGEISVGAETYDDAGESYNVTGIFNLPASDSFGLRGVAYLEDSSGFVKNACARGADSGSCPAAVANGFAPNGAKNSGHEYAFFRLHGAMDFSDRTSLLATVVYTKEDQKTDENVPAGVLDIDSIDTFGLVNGALDPGVGFWPNNRNTLSHDLPESTENESTVLILNLTHQLTDSMTLKWVTGLIDAETTRLFDNDLVGGADTLQRTNTYEGESWSTELRLDLAGENYDIVLGGIYAEDEQTQDNNVATGSQPTAAVGGVTWLPPFPAGLGLARNNKKWAVESFALFADFTYQATERLDVIVGGRYTRDEVTNDLVAFGIAPGVNPSDDFFSSFGNIPRPLVEAEESFNDFAPRFVLTYQAREGLNVYANISKGYKAGGNSVGNNTNADGQPGFVVPFDKEQLWNYEVGFKGQSMGGAMQLNGSLFFLDWKDLQMESFRFLTTGDLSSNFEQTINIGSAEALGVEIELLVAATERITLSSSLGYLDTEITSDTVAEITGGFKVELEGLEIPKAPELTFSLVAEYRFPVGANEGWVQAEYIHRDGQYSDVEALTYLQTDGPSPNQGIARNSIATFGDFPFRTPDHDVFNLRAGLDMDGFRVMVYVQNLSDESYFTGTQENFGVSGFRLRPHPRVIGGSLSFIF